jgi:hypothetical protein
MHASIDKISHNNLLSRVVPQGTIARETAEQRITMMNKAFATIAMTLGVLLASTAVSAKKPVSQEPAPVTGAMLVQVIGTVQAVDLDAHRVRIVDAQGHDTVLNVGNQLHDLKQVPVGSRIKSTAMQPVTLTPVRNAKTQEMIPGDKQFVAQVSSVDQSTGVVMLKDANQLPIEIHARDAQQAAKLSRGENVRVTLQDRKP